MFTEINRMLQSWLQKKIFSFTIKHKSEASTRDILPATNHIIFIQGYRKKNFTCAQLKIKMDVMVVEMNFTFIHYFSYSTSKF